MRGKFNAGCFVSISDFLRAFVIDFWASLLAQLVKNPPAMQETPVRFLGWEDPLEKERATHSSILAWRIPCTTVHGVAKESDTTEQTFTSPSDILGLLSWCNDKESTGQCHFQWQLSGEVFCSVFLSMPDMGMGLTGGASGKEPACQCRRLQRCRFDPCMGKIPWRRKWQPTPVFLPGKFHGQGCLVDYSPWSHKESDTTECAHTHTHTHTEQAFYQHFKVYLNCILIVVHGSVLRKCLKEMS